MQKRPRFEVKTKYGWFSLDEGAYADYLAGRLWITWPPEQICPKPPAEGLPPRVTDRALALREHADRTGVLPTAERELCGRLPLIPYAPRLEDFALEELNLSVRAYNGLMRAGIGSFGKLYDILNEEGGIGKIRNLGAKSEREIRTVFIEECYLQMLPYEKAEYWQRLLDCL